MPASRQGSKFSVEQVTAIKDVIVTNLEKGQTHTKSAEIAGISYMTMFRWLKEDDEWRALVDATDGVATKVIEDALYAKAAGGNVTAQIFYLCNRARERWVSVNRMQTIQIGEGAAAADGNGKLTSLRFVDHKTGEMDHEIILGRDEEKE